MAAVAVGGNAGTSHPELADFQLLQGVLPQDCDDAEGGILGLRDLTVAPLPRRSRRVAAGAALAAAVPSVLLLVAFGYGSGSSRSSGEQPWGAAEGVDWLEGALPSQAWAASPHDADGFCLASPGAGSCTLQHTQKNADTVKVSLFGNSYSGFYFWADYSLKHVIEGVQPSDWSVAGLTEQERNFKVSMHTIFNSGLAHHVDSFRWILLAEDPDYVALQDGSLIAMGWKGGMNQDGSAFKSSPQARRTAKAMQYTYGKAIWEWASKHQTKNGKKCVVFLVAAWARPEEAFVEAGAGKDAELEGKVSGSWAMKNYEVYREGVTPSLNSRHFIDVHHEGEMLQATLEGLGLYRERIFKGAAAKAGRKDGHEFRRDCPFEVSIVPVGVAFHDVRTRVEDVFRMRPVPDYWWSTVNRSSYVQFRPDEVHRQATQAERKTWFGAKEKNLLFTDVQKDMPWFGHPTPAGTFLYGIMVKRTILAVMQGRDGVKDGRSISQQVQLDFDNGVAKSINNLLIEEANHLDIEAFNKEWKIRGARVCDKTPWLCPGGGVHEAIETTVTATTTTTIKQMDHDPTMLARVVPVPMSSTENLATNSTTPTPSFRTTNPFEAARWLTRPHCALDFEDCRSSHRCCGKGLVCYEKNVGWAACLPSCKEGKHEEDGENFQTPWTCRVLEAKDFEGSGAETEGDAVQQQSSTSASANDAGIVAPSLEDHFGALGTDQELADAKDFAEAAVESRGQGPTSQQFAEDSAQQIDARIV